MRQHIINRRTASTRKSEPEVVKMSCCGKLPDTEVVVVVRCKLIRAAFVHVSSAKSKLVSPL